MYCMIGWTIVCSAIVYKDTTVITYELLWDLQKYVFTPARGHQRVGGFTLVEGLSPEIAILTVSGESLRTHYEEGPETLNRPA